LQSHLGVEMTMTSLGRAAALGSRPSPPPPPRPAGPPPRAQQTEPPSSEADSPAASAGGTDNSPPTPPPPKMTVKKTNVDPYVNSRWRRGFFHCGESYIEPRDGYTVIVEEREPPGAEAANANANANGNASATTSAPASPVDAAKLANSEAAAAAAAVAVDSRRVQVPSQLGGGGAGGAAPRPSAASGTVPGVLAPGLSGGGGNIDMSTAQIYGNHPLVPMGRGLGNGAVMIGGIPVTGPTRGSAGSTGGLGGMRSVGSVPSLQVISENASGPGEDLPGTLKVYTSTARMPSCKILPKVGSLVDLANIGLLKDSNHTPHNRKRPHALVVDDTQTSRMLLSRMLQKLGYMVTEVENGAEAVDTMRAVSKGRYQGVDIVFMDIVMPGMSGHVAVAEIRKLGGMCATVPVVAVTATDPGSLAEFDHVSKAGLRSGMSAIIAKPVNFKLVSDALCKHTHPRAADLPLRNREYMIGATMG